MDGNARWAKREGLSIAEGHKYGAENVKKIITSVADFGITYLTLFALSVENWKRSKEEISYLFKLLSIYLKSEESELNKNGIKLKVIGRLDLLNKKLKDVLDRVIESTKNNNRMTICIAFNYGSIQEITDACQKIVESGIKLVTTEDFKQYLYDPQMPDVDLLIRTSGEYRISNFLLWQSAYAELYFTAKYWPEFNREDLEGAINDYFQRKRNFGARK